MHPPSPPISMLIASCISVFRVTWIWRTPQPVGKILHRQNQPRSGISSNAHATLKLGGKGGNTPRHPVAGRAVARRQVHGLRLRPQRCQPHRHNRRRRRYRRLWVPFGAHAGKPLFAASSQRALAGTLRLIQTLWWIAKLLLWKQ